METRSLFFEGGLVNMSVVTAFGLIMVFFLIRKVLLMIRFKDFRNRHVNFILVSGILALGSALLIRTINIYQALGAIAEAGDISKSLFAKGYQVSLIAPGYGLIIFFISLVSWSILKEIIRNE